MGLYKGFIATKGKEPIEKYKGVNSFRCYEDVAELPSFAGVLRDDCIAFWEIGLAGEIRSVSFAELRIKEAIRLGFKKCIISEHNIKELPKDFYNQIEIVGVSNIRSAYYESTK